MKRTVILLIVFVLYGQLQAQNQLAKDQQAAHLAIQKMFDALSNRDSVSLKNYCTTDITLYEYGQVWNMDTLILKAITLNQSPGFNRTNSFEFINTTVDKKMASVTYYLQSVVIKDGKQVTVLWLETVVLVKEKKQWKVKHLHSTLIKRN
jgi:hypothetical protein